MSKQPLTNDDFRKLLATPVIKSGGSAETRSSSKLTGEGEKKKRKFYKPKDVVAKGEDKEEKAKYRDRAAERRDGVEEYEEAPELEGVDTRYLGGDVERTHLVKGLDVVLLEKIRREQEQQRRVAEEGANRVSGGVDVVANNGAAVEPQLDSLAYRISQVLNEDTAFREPSAAAALFAPGRMAYIFDLGSEVELPTKQMRAAMAASNKARKSVALTSHALVEEVANVLTYGPGGSARAKRESLAHSKATAAVVLESPKPAPPPRNKEDDIFGESDESDGNEQQQHETAALGGMQKGAAYFGTMYSHLRTEADAPDQVPAHLQALKRKVEAAAKAEERKEAALRKKEQEEIERSKAVASKESGAKGGFQSYFQRRETDLAPKESGSKFSDADLEFDMSAKAPTKYSKVIVEEDEEMDDQAVISSFKQGLEVFEDELKKKHRGEGKRARKGKDKQKLNQGLDQIAKVLKDKREDVDELLGRDPKKAKAESDGAKGGGGGGAE